MIAINAPPIIIQPTTKNTIAHGGNTKLLYSNVVHNYFSSS